MRKKEKKKKKKRKKQNKKKLDHKRKEAEKRKRVLYRVSRRKLLAHGKFCNGKTELTL